MPGTDLLLYSFIENITINYTITVVAFFKVLQEHDHLVWCMVFICGLHNLCSFYQSHFNVVCDSKQWKMTFLTFTIEQRGCNYSAILCNIAFLLFVNLIIFIMLALLSSIDFLQKLVINKSSKNNIYCGFGARMWQSPSESYWSWHLLALSRVFLWPLLVPNPYNVMSLTICLLYFWFKYGLSIT